MALLIISLILLCTSVLSIRIAWADRLRLTSDPVLVNRATELNSMNAQAFFFRAQYEEQQGKDARKSWQRAIDLDPRNPRILIQAGISSEIRGDFKEAEQRYLTAERYNALWLPRWTLANFYFRQGSYIECLRWIRLALERCQSFEVSALFNLAQDAGADPARILKDIVPSSSLLATSAYVYWIGRNQLTEDYANLMIRAAERVITVAGRDQGNSDWRYPIYFATQKLAEDGFGTRARALWRSACQSEFLECVAPPDDGLIANGAFSKPFQRSPMDWQLSQIQGISANQQMASGTLKLNFTGDQPETAPLLTQTLAIRAGEKWKVRFEFQTRDIAPREATGFEWIHRGRVLPLSKPLSSEVWDDAEFYIEASDQDITAPLILNYRRMPGTVRIRGDLWIRNIQARREN